MISPEEKTLIENIIGLFNQLVAGEAAEPEAPAAEEVVEMADDMGEVKDKPDVGEVEKAVDGETGDSKAEERFEETTDTTEYSLQEIGKSLMSIQNQLSGKKAVAKSSGNNALFGQLKNIELVLKGLVSRIQTNEKALGEVFKAVGFTDEVMKSIKTEQEQVQKTKPVQTMDAAAMQEMFTTIFKSIPGMTQSNEYKHPFNDKTTHSQNVKLIAKSIAEGCQRASGR